MQDLKPKLLPYVLESFAKLKQEADIVLVEGAGSASEINLRKNDIANMGFARAADVPVVVIGDIDRGGVIASLVGTKAVIDAEDAKLVAGFIVNRMRGDVSLFADGMAEIAKRTGWPALGLVPFFEGARRLPAEDAYDLVERRATRSHGKVRVAVPLLPHIANFDDLDPLAAEPDVDVVMVKQGHPLPVCDLIVLPGSKATIADLAALRAQGWDIDIAAHVRRGGHVLGLCGGYQMLGRTIADPHGIEGAKGSVPGLGLLQVDTVIEGEKTLAEVSGTTTCRCGAGQGLRDAHGSEHGCGHGAAAGALPRRPCRRRHLGVTAALPGPMCMASSPTTPSAAPGSNGSAARRRYTATMRRLKARSMRSPRISRRISTSIVCLE